MENGNGNGIVGQVAENTVSQISAAEMLQCMAEEYARSQITAREIMHSASARINDWVKAAAMTGGI